MSLLMQGLSELGFPSEEATTVACKMETYIRELEMFNAAYDLCGADTHDDIIVKHVLDSLSAAALIKEYADNVKHRTNAPAVIADIGSGGGFPGIPLAAALPEHTFVLVERMSKRCAFLENCTAVLGLPNVSVQNTEAERVPPATADIAVFRAFRPLDKKMIRMLLRIIKPDGLLAAYKAKRENIVSEMENILDIASNYEIKPLSVPFMNEYERNLVVIRHRR